MTPAAQNMDATVDIDIDILFVFHKSTYKDNE
jgi:hypothetical protein